MAFSNAGGGRSRPQMNVTPLIDVLLVLIIVFMVVVSMDKSKGFDTQIPQPPKNPNEPPPPERTIVIQVEWIREGQVPALKINSENVKWVDLQQRLQGIFAGRIERVAFVRGDNDIDFEDIAKVIDIAKKSGVDRVGLLPKDREVSTE
jgi:biopolymer transport protein TolR